VTKTALIICTPTALQTFNSGASLRVLTIESILMKGNYTVSKVSYKDFRKFKNLYWDIIVVVSYAASDALGQASRQSKLLWFDATDSWHESRLNRFKSGETLQLLALGRDVYRMSKVNSIPLVSFISKTDADAEFKFVEKKASQLFIFPNTYAKSKVINSQKRRIVFVGDGTYGPNRRSIQFLEKVVESLPANLEITLIGRNLHSKNPRLISVGYVPDALLYESRDIHVAPIFSGGGIKNKVVGPIFNQIPVITTKHGSNGLLPHPNIHIANSVAQFASQIQLLLDHEFDFKPQKLFETDETIGLIEELSN